MAEVLDGLSLHYDDGAGRHWYPELRAPQYLRASDIDWHGVFQTEATQVIRNLTRCCRPIIPFQSRGGDQVPNVKG